MHLILINCFRTAELSVMYDTEIMGLILTQTIIVIPVNEFLGQIMIYEYSLYP